ncbi:MAG: antitoxin VapB family protein [Methanophagales archaeon]|nr:antitoxin VapB family protein [Methanophagales archaeon]
MVKTITIRDDVYEKLRVLKGDESLSDLIERLIGSGKGIEVLKKIRGTIDLSNEEKKAILKEIYVKRTERTLKDLSDLG